VKIIEPSYEIIAPEELNEEKMLKFLEQQGRTCYKSHNKITEDSAKKFVKKIIKNGHHSVLEHVNFTIKFVCDRGCCYDKDTQVLTENGFKLFKDLKENEKVYTLDDDNNLILITPKKIINKKYDGEMINFSNTFTDLLVTPNHNMWIYDQNKRSKLTKIWKFEKAENLNNKHYKFYRGCENYIGKKIDEIIIPPVITKRGFYNKYCKVNKKNSFNAKDFLKFLGIWITDGNIVPPKNTTGHRIVITQIKQEGCYYIENLLKKLGIKYNKYKNDYRISNKALYEFLIKNFIKEPDYKKTYYMFIPKWIKNLNKELIECFLEGVIVGNGSKRQDDIIEITSGSEQFAKDLIEIALKIGKTGRYTAYFRTEEQQKTSFIKQKNTNYLISIIKSKNTNFWNRNKNTYKKIQYNDYVYCVELPKYHKLFVMKNGKTAWCGNSHELVRHRTGIAFSQESTRYCDYSKDEEGIKFIRPSFFEDKWDKEQRRLWLCSISKAEDTYKALIKLGATPQEARSILPNALATEIIMTCNLRELRHILSLRCSGAAHPDMKFLMTKLLQYLQIKLPILVADIL